MIFRHQFSIRTVAESLRNKKSDIPINIQQNKLLNLFLQDLFLREKEHVKSIRMCYVLKKEVDTL